MDKQPPLLYFDYAAATPVRPEVLAVMMPYFSEKFYNPSSVYLAAQDVRNDISAARESVAQTIGARPQEIIFTAGGTESSNSAIHGVMSQFIDAHAVTTTIEHEAVLAPLEEYAHTAVGVDAKGIVAASDVIDAIHDNTVLVSVMLANNEVGTVQRVADIAAHVQRIRKSRRSSGNKRPLYLHTDACQAALYLDVHVSRLGVDLMTLNGGKMYGPKQSGILYMHKDVVLSSRIQGGGQERNLRSGTENVAAIIGFSKALELAQAERKETSRRVLALQRSMIAQLQQAIPESVLNGHAKMRLPNNINILLPGIDGERLVMELDEKGLLVATGSACSASSDDASHVLRAIGLDNNDASASLRITLGMQTTQAIVDKAAMLIVETYKNMR